MTEIQICAIYSQFLGEFTANFKDSYLLAYSPMCESITSYLVLFSFPYQDAIDRWQNFKRGQLSSAVWQNVRGW